MGNTVYLSIVFKNGIEKHFEVKLNENQNKQEWIAENAEVIRQKFRDSIGGGSLVFVTVQDKTVVISMDEIQVIELD